jgi:disulfide bond formation protein DsbB
MRSSRYSRAQASTPTFLIFAAVACATLLAIAHIFETFGHLPPCELCLSQRDGYWAAFWAAMIGIGATRFWRRAPRGFAVLLGLIFLAETMLAAYHAGVEWKWWAGPTACTGTHATITAADMSSLLKGVKVHMVRCDQAAWRWLGLSMAGWNALCALGLTVASFAAASVRIRR